jgi:hypothetical protein
LVTLVRAICAEPLVILFRLGLASVVVLLLFSVGRADSFSRAGTVVALAGLPGDMESEQTYRDETQQLLQLLRRPDLAPKQVLLLTSIAPAPGPNDSYALTVLSNDRASFLGLADRLKNSPAPCTFMVFGHGGSQGAVSVFHVPGPRLTPDDFLNVAKAQPSAAWVLFSPDPGILRASFRRRAEPY